MSGTSGRCIPSTWFQWHASLIRKGMRVLDVASGQGCHAIAAAQRGASVVAIESDPDLLREAEAAAQRARVTVEWVQAEPADASLPEGPFDLVMQYHDLDRSLLPRLLDAVKPGGYVEVEAFLERQRELGWGPTSDARLLKTGELWSLVRDFEIMLAREVLEILDGRTRAVASVLARRPLE